MFARHFYSSSLQAVCKVALSILFSLFPNALFAQGVNTSGAESKPELVAQTGHVFPILKLAISQDGKLVASSSFNDSSVILWDVENERELRAFSAETTTPGGILSGVSGIDLSADGHLLAALINSDLIVWEVEHGQELYRSPASGPAGSVLGLAALRFSPSGRLIALLREHSIQVINAQDGTPVR